MRHTVGLVAALVLVCAGCSAPGAYLRDRALDFADCFIVEAGLGLGADVEAGVTDWLATGVGAAVSAKWGFAGRHPVGLGCDRMGCDFHLGFPFAPVVFWFMDPLAGPPWGKLRVLYTHTAVRDSPVPLFLIFGGPQDRFVADGRVRLAIGPDGRVYGLKPSDIEEPIEWEREISAIVLFNVAALKENRGRGYRAKWVEAFDVDAGATLLPVSARVGFSLGQFADLLLGWTTLDLAGDDE